MEHIWRPYAEEMEMMEGNVLTYSYWCILNIIITFACNTIYIDGDANKLLLQKTSDRYEPSVSDTIM